MRGAAAIAPVGAPKTGHVSVLEDGREAGTGLLGWASSRVAGDCGEGKVGLAPVGSLIEGEDRVITEQFASSLGVKLVSTAGLEQYCSTHEVCKLTVPLALKHLVTPHQHELQTTSFLSV